MSRKLDDFELVTMKERNNKLEFKLQHQQTQKEESHYQCLSTTNREEPEQFMNSTRKQETEPVLLEPEIYMNIAHAKKEAQPNTRRLSQERGADKDAADFTPTPAVSSHHRAMEILKTYIKAEPVTRNAAGSDTESDTSDLTPAPSPQRSGRSNTYISSHTSTKMKSSGPSLKSDVSTQPAMHPIAAVGQNRNHPDVAGNLLSVASSSKGKSKNMSLLLLIVVCCVLVAFLVFTLLLTFTGLNRSELMKNQAGDSHSTATSNRLIMNLTKQVRDLEESLKQVKIESNTAIRNLNASLSQMKMERDAAIRSLNAQSNILAVNITKQVRDLEESLSQMITQSAASLTEKLNRSSQQIRRDLSALNSHVVRLGNEDNNLLSNITSHVRATTATTTTLSSRISSNYFEVSGLRSYVNTNLATINSELTRLSRLSSCIPHC